MNKLTLTQITPTFWSLSEESSEGRLLWYGTSKADVEAKRAAYIRRRNYEETVQRVNRDHLLIQLPV